MVSKESKGCLHMDYDKIGERVKALYDRDYSISYRKSDELVIKSDVFSQYNSLLKSVCKKFTKKIDVLDIGCGTGRYFHCLENVTKLTGIDISESMIECASLPVKAELVMYEVELMVGNVFDMSFESESFNLIYSIGVFGEHSPFDAFICNKLYTWLRPEGILLFTTVDSSSKQKGIKRRIAESILPFWFQKILNQRRGYFYMQTEELKRIMVKSPFKEFKLFKIEDIHVHDVCVATK